MLSDQQLVEALDRSNPEGLKLYESLRQLEDPTTRNEQLSDYFKNKLAIRYYFNWRNFDSRFKTFQSELPDEQKYHQKQGELHLGLYRANTTWDWPRNDQNGNPISAYQFRHLARQQDVESHIFTGFYEQNIKAKKQYFVDQVSSLMEAYQVGAYEDRNHGVFATFIAGRRVYTWLFIHNALLSRPEYSTADQLLLIKTFLAHGADLAERCQTYEPGNHHTRGLVALYEIAALFSEFTDTKDWRELAVDGLLWHMDNEIGSDGFQFERSVFYHMGDIENYFRVARLASNCGYDLPEKYWTRLKSMFNSLELLSQDNGKVPPLQDCSGPYGDEISISSAMIMGFDAFRESAWMPLLGNELPRNGFWLLSDDLVKEFHDIEGGKPEQKQSSVLRDAGYYIMRSYKTGHLNQIIISAGLSEIKPDHQQGDMLGFTLYSEKQSRLPNYEVQYNDPEYRDFKNSLAKNVAIVDGMLQGKYWTGKPGGTGFATWGCLPEPEVLNWMSNDNYDYFAGTHDGYDSIGVDYLREIIYLKPSVLVVADHFRSSTPHDYSQIWQGDFSRSDDENAFTRVFEDGYHLDLNIANEAGVNLSSGILGSKAHTVFTVNGKSNYDIITILGLNLQGIAGSDGKISARDPSQEWMVQLDAVKHEIKLSKSASDEMFLLKNLFIDEDTGDRTSDISTILTTRDGDNSTLLSRINQYEQ